MDSSKAGATSGASAPNRGRVAWPRRVVIPLVALLVVVIVPVAAVAGGRFADVQGGSTHATGIGWVADTGVTAGCDPAGTEYCPTEAVTRAQMATFMQRLAGHAPGIDPSVDAATVGGLTADDVTAMQPVAFGRIHQNGDVSNGSGNFTVIWVAALSHYRISIDDVAYSINSSSAIVTPINCAGVASDFTAHRTGSVGGALTVFFEGDTQCSFGFVAYEGL